MTHRARGTEYVERVRRDTQEYIRELLESNANLRRINASYEGELETRSQEVARSLEELLETKERLQLFETEQRRLRRQLVEIENEKRSFAARFVEVERQNNNLANLYVVSHRLSETLDRCEVLEALNEIIRNLIGSEEFAILETSDEHSRLSLARAEGLSPEQIEVLDRATGPVARAVRDGEIWVAEEKGVAEHELVACVPLALADHVYGVIAIFTLLSHKPGLEPLDFELFDLLASHGAMSLYAASLHERTAQVA